MRVVGLLLSIFNTIFKLSIKLLFKVKNSQVYIKPLYTKDLRRSPKIFEDLINPLRSIT